MWWAVFNINWNKLKTFWPFVNSYNKMKTTSPIWSIRIKLWAYYSLVLLNRYLTFTHKQKHTHKVYAKNTDKPICTLTYTLTPTSTPAPKHPPTHTHAHTHTHIHTHAHRDTHKHEHKHAHTQWLPIHKIIYIQIYTQSYAHTHIQT